MLGLIQNNRAGLFTLPAIANGAFVFDEVHAYDDRMFGALLRFIGSFRCAPVLLMTASLQAHRLDAVRQLCAESGQAFAIVEGPNDLEQIPRYHFVRATLKTVWKEVARALASGKRLLWVVNTVDRAVELYQLVRERGDWPVVAYHSRFRYADRVRKHRAVVDAFKANRGPFLAITTQVCEVSLDLSADLLVTDLAPVPAMIQRLGRLNRFVTPEAPGRPRSALVLTSPFPAPYEQSDPDLAGQWLDRLGPGALSQADLAAAWSALTAVDQCDAGGSAWLDGGPVSEQRPLREPGRRFPSFGARTRTPQAATGRGDTFDHSHASAASRARMARMAPPRSRSSGSCRPDRLLRGFGGFGHTVASPRSTSAAAATGKVIASPGVAGVPRPNRVRRQHGRRGWPYRQRCAWVP